VGEGTAHTWQAVNKEAKPHKRKRRRRKRRMRRRRRRRRRRRSSWAI
jgi:hypothetical protein